MKSACQYSFFVTGTDTEIGKTLVTSALLHGFSEAGLRTIGMKPIAAGADLIAGIWHNEDVDCILAAGNVDCSTQMDLVVPYLMRVPAAPHIVAGLENIDFDLSHIKRCYQQLQAQADVVLVEGVGGYCVPLNDTLSTVDMARELALPVIMVVGLRLGCINHALLTAQAIAASGMHLIGWVANTVDPEMKFLEENVQALRQRLPAPCLGVIPRLAQASAQQAASFLDLNFLK